MGRFTSHSVRVLAFRTVPQGNLEFHSLLCTSTAYFNPLITAAAAYGKSLASTLLVCHFVYFFPHPLSLMAMTVMTVITMTMTIIMITLMVVIP